MRSPRFGIRSLMIAVAVVALMFGILAGLQRGASGFREVAAFHRSYPIKAWGSAGGPYDDDVYWYDQAGNPLTGTELRRARWHAHLANKYEVAADRPWLPVRRDPPEPE